MKVETSNPQSAPSVGGLELCPLGEGAVLHSRISSAMVVTNALGMAVYRALSDGTSPHSAAATFLGVSEAEARPIVEQALADWAETGLFETEPRDFLETPSHRAAVDPMVITYRLGPNAVTMVCEDRHLMDQIHGVLGPLDHTPGPGGDETVEILSEGDRYGIFRDGMPLFGRCGINAARYLVVRDMFERLAGRDRAAVSIHAGAVGQGGRALILAGSSGAGKTTLTLGLAQAGCDYLADDHVVLEDDAAHIVALPVRASAKARSWHLEEVAPYLAAADQPTPRQGVRPAAPPGAVEMGSRHRVAALIFPGFSVDAPNTLERLKPEAAFLRFIDSGARPTRHMPTIAPIAQLLDSVPCYALRHNSSAYSVPACLDLLQSP